MHEHHDMGPKDFKARRFLRLAALRFSFRPELRPAASKCPGDDWSLLLYIPDAPMVLKYLPT